jgi:[acyl-carrier-protein] S-malonyltransferase
VARADASSKVPGRVSIVSTDVTAGLFPGQGSHTSDLRERVERVLPALLAECIALVGDDPFARVGESTRFAQPAIFCASVAGWEQRPAFLRPVALAGHSLGELSALVAAGALDQRSGLKLAVLRGELMASASGGQDESMLAVLGGSEEQVRQLADEHQLVIANDNAPGQAVLAGPTERLRLASRQAREQRVRAILLDVTGAFHTPAMAGAVAPFRAALEEIELAEPAIPVISGASARPFLDIREELAGAIVQPVRWRQTMLALAELGANSFVDFGPGEVLAKLVARNLPDAAVIDIAAPAAHEDARQASHVA